MPYKDLVSELAALEELPPAAFRSSATCPQEVCDLVLALAAVYNDFHDIAFSHMLLHEVEPTVPQSPTTEWGNYGALFASVLRLRCGVIHELIDLVRHSKRAANHPYFQAYVASLGTDTVYAWKAITDVAFGQPRADPLGSALLLVRNKVAFHYDPKELGRGLASHLGANPKHRLFVSRGGSLRSTRFYFAGAAAEQAIVAKASDPAVLEFLNFRGPLIEKVNLALYRIVTEFVRHRGFTYSPYAPVV
jgi:hypothetical protein